MQAVATTDRQHKLERALAQLELIESTLPSLQLRTLELEAWIEFHERGRRFDA